jgi:hypothetical protein
MTHSRKLVIGSVGLTNARIPAKLAGPAMDQVRDELEQIIIRSDYLGHAPFKWVGLIIREGLVDEVEPHYERINKKHGDLPIAIEIDTHRLLGASSEEMRSIYRKAAIIALIHAGDKYNLSTDHLKSLINSGELRQVPGAGG